MLCKSYLTQSFQFGLKSIGTIEITINGLISCVDRAVRVDVLWLCGAKLQEQERGGTRMAVSYTHLAAELCCGTVGPGGGCKCMRGAG